MNKKRVLIIEDDMDAAEVLEAYLVREHFAVSIATDGLQGLDMAQQWRPDLILLDVLLPGIAGTEVLNRLRKKNDTPVIMISAMSDASDKIGALRYGADDYIVKPYNPGEVMARVHAVMRRYSDRVEAHGSLSFGPLQLDTEAMAASVEMDSGETQFLTLTPTEFTLLATFLRAPTKAFSRQELLEKCLPESDALERVVDTHIYNLRKKLENVGVTNVLLTVRAIGYRFKPL
ncbi:response regulator transcription factor [Serratia proteamaculans]|jgi:DNA-binding response OmpR family regulator|uniref:response regulator n=1 Tax=Serratia TaxID=613 RepID=UPI0015771B9D|nr:MULTISPECIES: response regulator [Serratia]NTX79538.1 response regulator transcription factor [Serratia proteamaculans]NTZ28740.1 response regulator transcription factor [Serratia proteamaculans]CAI0769216.1 Transcriptional regulatory protein BaeR [Serratia quinivorans]CAI1640429.1 Transcriptional regulatory protein BaeR [Serratia quinivorans]